MRFVCLALSLGAGAHAATGPRAIAPPAGDTVRYVQDHLFGVDFVDGTHGWVTGYYGTVLRTESGGRQWARRSVGVTDLLRRVDFADADTGWAVGHRGEIFATTDGGASWTVQHREPGTYLRDVSFVDRHTGWAVGHDQTILHTTDGGRTWERQQLAYEGRDPPRLSGVAAFSATHAVLAGEFGVLAETRDGGATWRLLPSPTAGTYTAIAAAGDHAVAVGLDGMAVLVPRQGGAPVALSTGTRLHLLDVTLDSDGRGFAVGLGSAYRIDGAALRPVRLEVAGGGDLAWLGGVASLPAGGAVAVGSNGLIVSWDAGRNAFVQSARWRR